jgi:hypothetical protein
MFKRFSSNRRAAVAVIMAIALVPLVLLVGIAVDITFLYQSRTQTAFAAQAAATQALRIAAATYQVEVANGSIPSVAAQHAIDAGNTAGNLWFNAEVGTLIRTTLSSPTTKTTYDGYDGTANTSVNTSETPNFSATVNVTGTYPPIFDPIFNSNANWVYASNASATTSYAYAQILFMLDTSNSMLIGARQQDIETMETHAVCIPQNTVQFSPAGFDDQPLSYNTPGGNDNDYNFAPGDNTYIGFSPTDNSIVPAIPVVPNYNTGQTGTTAVGTEPPQTTTPGTPGGSAPYQMRNASNTQTGLCDNTYTGPYEPCALACHTQSTATFSLNGKSYSADLYGLARSEGVELRVDVLLSATENAIQDMIASAAISNQFAVGVYQFNVDVAPIVRGSSGDSLPEATTNLQTALKAVQNVDYNNSNYGQAALAPTAAPIPVLVTDCNTYTFPSQENCHGNTDLIQSMDHLVKGKLPTDTGAQALTASGDGSAESKPLKFLFLVTDGMEDESSLDGAADLAANPAFSGKGVMTTPDDQSALSTTPPGTGGTCTALKKLGYTIYVLYVDYLPVSQSQYYSATSNPLSQETKSSYSLSGNNLVNIADSEPDLAKGAAQGLTDAQITKNIVNDVPTANALSNCASSPSDFYTASSDTDIQTALSEMLKAALASTIRLTN